MSEKRQHERIKWTARVDITDQGTKKIIAQNGRIRNVSKRGLFVLTEDEIRLNAIYDFTIYLDTIQTIKLTGRVIRVKRDSIYQLSAIVLDPPSIQNRVELMRLLSSKGGSYQARARLIAVSIGCAVGVIGALFFGWPIASAIGAALVTTLIFVYWSPF